MNFLDRFAKNKQLWNFMNIRPVGTELFHANGRTDRQRVAFRNFVNTSENFYSIIIAFSVERENRSFFYEILERISIYFVVKTRGFFVLWYMYNICHWASTGYNTQFLCLFHLIHHMSNRSFPSVSITFAAGVGLPLKNPVLIYPYTYTQYLPKAISCTFVTSNSCPLYTTSSYSNMLLCPVTVFLSLLKPRGSTNACLLKVSTCEVLISSCSICKLF